MTETDLKVQVQLSIGIKSTKIANTLDLEWIISNGSKREYNYRYSLLHE